MQCLVEIFCLVICCVVYRNRCSAVNMKRLEKRLALVEYQIDLWRDDTKAVIAKLEEVDKRLNSSIEMGNFIRLEVDNSSRDAYAVDEVTWTHQVTQQMKGMNDSFQLILKGFADEKKMNSRIRRRIPEMENEVTRYNNRSEMMIEYAVNASHALSVINKRLDEIVLAGDNGTLLSRFEDTVAGNLEEVKMELLSSISNITGVLSKLLASETVDKNLQTIIKETETVTSCLEWYKRGKTVNGVYDIYPVIGNTSIRVYCDQETDGGGWTVFQRRVDGTVDFFRNWIDYKIGFGDLKGEFWLGNTYLSILTSPCCHELRVELKDFENNQRFAKYKKFRVGSEAEEYKLTVSGYSGDAGDSLSYHNNSKFSTRDRDNDGRNCANRYKGAWWFNACHYSDLNGLYLRGKHSKYAEGVNWRHWLGHGYSLQFVEMKFR